MASSVPIASTGEANKRLPLGHRKKKAAPKGGAEVLGEDACKAGSFCVATEHIVSVKSLMMIAFSVIDALSSSFPFFCDEFASRKIRGLLAVLASDPLRLTGHPSG